MEIHDQMQRLTAVASGDLALAEYLGEAESVEQVVELLQNIGIDEPSTDLAEWIHGNREHISALVGSLKDFEQDILDKIIPYWG